MPYVDLATIQTTDPGDPLTAAWCDQVRDNDEFFIDPPVCAVNASSSQSLANNTITALTANTERFDNDSMHSTVTNTARITIQTAGRYLLACVVRFAHTATFSTPRLVQFRFNGSGSTVINVAQVDSSINGASRDTILSGATAENFAAGDYIEVTARQEAGGNLNVTLDNFVALFLTR